VVCRGVEKQVWASLMGLLVIAAIAPAMADEPVKAGGDRVAVKSDAGLPSAVDLRPVFKRLGLAPRAQRHRPTCSVFTTAGAMEFAVSKHFGRPSPLSVEYLNWAANQVIGNKTQSRGQFFRHLLKGFDRYGICLEADMPYLAKFDPEAKPSEAASKRAKEIRELGLQIHQIAEDVAGETQPEQRRELAFRKVKETLARGYPVAAGSHHSLLLVGYTDDASKPGGGVVLTRDSGKGAYSSVTYDHVRMKMGGFFYVTPPEKTSAAKPQTRPAAG
jgi:hypothetical protein